MKVEYLEKARGMITMTDRIDAETLLPGDVGIPIPVTDSFGDHAARSTINVNNREYPD